MNFLVIESHMKDESFVDAIEQNQLPVKLIESRLSKQGGWNSFLNKLFFFWTGYLRLSVRGLASSREGDLLITWQVFVGVVTGLFMRLFNFKRKLVVLSFICRPRNNRLLSRMRFVITRMGLSSASKVVCYSKSEERTYTELFRLPNTGFCFIPLGKTFVTDASASATAGNDGLFTAGQSNRDYATLINAMRNVDARLTIATTNKVDVPKDLLDQIEIGPLEGADFRKKMADSTLVILPLIDTDYSSGQIILINAMAQSKCVILTESAWSGDYVIHGQDAWLVPPRDVEAMAVAINMLLKDSRMRENIGCNARQRYNESFNGKRFGERISQIIRGI